MNKGRNNPGAITPVAETRRDFLYVATGMAAAVGAAASLWPFIDSMRPSADVGALAAIEIDISLIQPGQRVTVKWRGKPVFVVHRTQAMIRQRWRSASWRGGRGGFHSITLFHGVWDKSYRPLHISGAFLGRLAFSLGEDDCGEANLNRGFGQSPPSLSPAGIMVIMGGDMMTGTMSTFSFWLLKQFPILTKIG